MVREKGYANIIYDETTQDTHIMVRTADKRGNSLNVIGELKSIIQPWFVKDDEVVFSKRKRFIGNIVCSKIQVLSMTNVPHNFYGQNRVTNLYKVIYLS